MKIKELMALLSNYDPEVNVEVSVTQTDWEYSEIMDNSSEVDRGSYQELEEYHITLTTDGILQIGQLPGE